MRTMKSELKRTGLVVKKTPTQKDKTSNHSKSYEYQKSVEAEERRQRELAELMGTNRDTFKRVKGSIRKK